jgi:asparagine synthase (glutamine-hydrolysing)
MCGIAGALVLDGGAALAPHAALEAARSLRHRGPDGEGVRALGPVTLIHTRLGIIDLATGDQPMSNEDGSIWVVFNGEIFNYIELRRELTACGHRFRTQSDTETLVHAYEQWGDDFVTRLNGQFAIALWDARRGRLLLVRDRVGIRPLFVRESAGRLDFASEVKALARLGDAALRLDARGLAQVFTFWSTVGSRSVFAGVRAIPPGHMLVCERGAQQLRRWWDWEFPPAGGVRRLSMADAAAELRELLADAVRLQLRADVPVGAYLSGGLDSSGLVALVSRNAGQRLETFSVAFDDREFDESAHQQTMARFLGTTHHTVRCDQRAIGALFPRLLAHLETPILRTAPAPLMMLSALVREHGLKVVLTGEGADEVFAGYDLFKEAKVRRFWARRPDSRWRSSLFARLYPYLRNSPVALRSFTQSFFGQDLLATASPTYGHQTRWSTTRRAMAFFSDELRAELGAWRPDEDFAAGLPARATAWEPLARDQYVEAHTLLSGYLLCSQGDRVAMANSVEGRVPFLDHRVIELANDLPARLKLPALREKSVLREALRPLLPADIVARTKQPYRAPDVACFFEDGRPLEYVRYQLSPERLREVGLFSPAAVAKLVEKCSSGRAIGFADNMAFVGILSTMLVEDQFVRARARGEC